MDRRAPLRPLLILGTSALMSCGLTTQFESSSNDNSPGNRNSNNNTSSNNNTGSGGSSDAGVYAPPDEQAPDPQLTAPAFNPYVAVDHDPFSTFAADVDSASYDIFAKAAEARLLPAPSTVRSEEFVNYFRYVYAVPDLMAPHPFAITIDLGNSPAGDTYLLKVGVQGKDLLADRPPANLVFLVDTSGSMGAYDKLPLAQEMLRSALGVLRPDDQIAMVTYSGTTQVVLPVTPVSQRERIEDAIAGLVARGGTAGGDGLNLAYDQATQGFIEGGVNHIILCTDGDFNIGPYSDAELVSIVETNRSTGVTFTALGFGRDNLNDSMMEAISNAGNGIYRVITGVKTAQRYVSGRLLSDVVHIAKDVKLQVEFSPEYVQAYRQVGYENRQLADGQFRDDVVDAGEIGSGHQMTALYELVLVEGVVPAPDGAPAMLTGDPVEGDREIQPGELVRVKLRYKAPGATATDPATEMTASLGPQNAADALDPESAFAWAVATFAGRLANNPFVEPEHLSAVDPIVSAAAEGASDRRDFVPMYQAARARLP